MEMPGWKIWFMAARPKTLPAGVAPVLMGAAMAYGDHGFHARAAACALIGALLIQIGTNLANDYFDHIKGTDTEERLGPTRATQAGWVTPRAMFVAALAVFLAACVPGLYLVLRGGWPLVAIGLVSICCGILYTGGPMPLGYVGLGDLFVLVFFGPVAVGGTYYVQTLVWSTASLWAGVAAGLFSVAILTVNNLRDIEQDRAGNKRTLPVRFGRTFARCEYFLSLAAASIAIPLGLALTTGRYYTMAAAIAMVAAIPTIRTVFVSTDGPALNEALAWTGKLLLLFSVTFSIGWLV